MHITPLLFAPLLGRFPYYPWNRTSELVGRHSVERSLPVGTLLSRQIPVEVRQHQLQGYTISLPLDHDGETDVRFNNRFWVNATYYKPGGPVIFYDIGEASGEETAALYLTEPEAPSPVMRLASRYKGLAIAWEHRFYGESVPFNYSKSFSPEWQYHTIQQALDDVVVFANSFSNSTSPSKNTTNPFQTYAVHPSQTPWIAVAGSYPGARIAFLRDKHPEIFFAGWGSSVCSGGDVVSPGYYNIIQSTLPANCSADWAAIRRYIDEQIHDGSPGALSKLRFREDETVVLLLPALNFQTFGREYSTDKFCDDYETLGRTREASPQGLVAELGIEAAYKAYADYLEAPYQASKRNLDQDPDSSARQGMESWWYQTCTEFGSFAIHDRSNPNSFVSSVTTEKYQLEFCRQMFRGAVPKRPRVEVLNDLGGRDVNPSNFFFTDGEIDPWRTLTPSWPKKKGTVRTASEARPKCNTRPPLDQYFGKVYPNVAHMPDHRTYLGRYIDRPDLVARNAEIFNTSLKLFQEALDEWLPCFSGMPPGHIGDGRPVHGAAQSLKSESSTIVLWSLGVVAAMSLYM